MHGDLARLRAKGLRKSYTKTDRNEPSIVWMDAKKTVSEFYPGRITRKAYDIVKIFEAQKNDPLSVMCNLKDLTVSIGEDVMASFRVSPPIFTTKGLQRYTELERGQITSAR